MGGASPFRNELLASRSRQTCGCENGGRSAICVFFRESSDSMNEITMEAVAAAALAGRVSPCRNLMRGASGGGGCGAGGAGGGQEEEQEEDQEEEEQDVEVEGSVSDSVRCEWTVVLGVMLGLLLLLLLLPGGPPPLPLTPPSPSHL